MIVVGALGTLRKDFAKVVQLISGRPKVSEIQTMTLFGKCLDESLRALVAERNNTTIP